MLTVNIMLTSRKMKFERFYSKKSKIYKIYFLPFAVYLPMANQKPGKTTCIAETIMQRIEKSGRESGNRKKRENKTRIITRK